LQLSCEGTPNGFIELSGKNISINSPFEFSAEFNISQDLLVSFLTKSVVFSNVGITLILLLFIK